MSRDGKISTAISKCRIQKILEQHPTHTSTNTQVTRTTSKMRTS